jgi:hypothetical protein
MLTITMLRQQVQQVKVRSRPTWLADCAVMEGLLSRGEPAVAAHGATASAPPEALTRIPKPAAPALKESAFVLLQGRGDMW